MLSRKPTFLTKFYFTWLVCPNKNLTWENLEKRLWYGPNMCPICKRDSENNNHIFLVLSLLRPEEHKSLFWHAVGCGICSIYFSFHCVIHRTHQCIYVPSCYFLDDVRGLQTKTYFYICHFIYLFMNILFFYQVNLAVYGLLPLQSYVMNNE